MNPVLYLIVLVPTLRFISTETVENEDGTNLIFNLNITGEISAQLSRFSNYTTVGFLNSTLSPMIEQDLQNLAQTENFACRDGFLEALEIIPRFREIQLHSCQTTNITNQPGRGYELNALVIVDSNVTELPRNFGLLTKLERIYIAETLIEHVEMNEFKKLVKLKMLYLIDSRIKTISSVSQSSIEITSLRGLNLTGNQLSRVSFAAWNAPWLEKISMCNNQLQEIFIMPFNFPKLKELDLSNNSLDCCWRKKMKLLMDERKVEFLENTICS